MEENKMLMPTLFHNDLFDDFFDFPRHMTDMVDTNTLMKTDIKENGNNYELYIDIPGFNKEDIKSLQDFGNLLKNEFGNSLNSLIKNVEASNVRGNHPAYNATNTLDENHKSYWTTDDEICKASITFTFQKPTLVNRSEIREYLPLGQRISSFSLEIQTESNEWKEVAKATTIGNRRLLRFADVKAKAIRLNILESQACPVISDIRFFLSSNKYETFA